MSKEFEANERMIFGREKHDIVELKIIFTMYRAMRKSELAKCAGIPKRTFTRYIKLQQPMLSAIGVSSRTQILPPKAVKMLCEALDIELF